MAATDRHLHARVLAARAAALAPTLALALAGCSSLSIAPVREPGTRRADADDRASEDDGDIAPTRLSLSLQQDFGLLTGGADCARGSQLAGEVPCFRGNDTQYHGTPARGSEVAAGGLHPATTRILAGVERVMLERWSLGVRAGIAVRGGPRPDGGDAPAFLPVHAEGRATYWLARAPFASPGFRLGLFAGGGVAQVDTRVDIGVREETAAPPPVAQLDNPPAQTLAAWHKAGTGFVGGGLTLACAFRASSSFFVEVRGMQLFPSSGTTFAQAIGFEQGF